MKIVFLCGALEPGKDGVGDYTRRLASKLKGQSISVFLIAFNDAFISAGNETKDGDDSENSLRIAAHLPESHKLDILGKTLEAYQPDYISLQFVPYSFHKKGLPFLFVNKLRHFRRYRWHIMFHELWLDKPEKQSQYVIAFLQRQAIKLMVRACKPGKIHVSLPFNQQRLSQINIESSVLELFGNIPYYEKKDKLPSCIVGNITGSVLYFGGAPRDYYLEQILSGIKAFCVASDRPISLVVVSPESHNKRVFIEKVTHLLSGYKGSVIDCGFLETEELSTLMSYCSAGIVRSEPYLIGKSGSAISMLEHGLPIWLPKWNSNEVIEMHFRKELIHSTLLSAMQTKHENYEERLDSIANQFIADLNLYS